MAWLYANPAVGETAVFTVQAFNHGPLAATGVVISDRLPLGLTFDSAHASQGAYAGDTGGWPVGRLNAGVGATLTLSATVDAGAAGLTITNTAAISAADQVDPDPTNNVYTVAFSVPALKVVRNFLPLIVRNYAPSLTFPLHVGPAIPVRPVAYQGELFYTTSLRIPGELPPGGRFYFSSQRDAVAQALVDDELVLLLGGTERFSYLFATVGPPQPAVVELPRAVLETLLGQTVTLEYRDVYGVVVEASEMWLIWVP
jgi:uncharacterized repeat protein (TIGR01451 family)